MVQRKVHSKKPKAGDWDVTADGMNYRTTCNRPYWHEAHHIIPNGALHDAILSVGKGTGLEGEIAAKIRDGLLQAGYNLNHKRNMMILPIEKQISDAICLPIHVDRSKAANLRHTSYSAHVQQRLNEIFAPVKSKVDPSKHEIPNLEDTKTELEMLSDTLRTDIKGAGRRAPGTFLEDNFKPTR